MKAREVMILMIRKFTKDLPKIKLAIHLDLKVSLVENKTTKPTKKQPK